MRWACVGVKDVSLLFVLQILIISYKFAIFRENNIHTHMLTFNKSRGDENSNLMFQSKYIIRFVTKHP